MDEAVDVGEEIAAGLQTGRDRSRGQNSPAAGQQTQRPAVDRRVRGTGMSRSTQKEGRYLSTTENARTVLVCFENGTSETICKSSISREDVNDAWCAVHVSVEAPVPSMQRALDAVEPVSVTRYRKTVDGHHVDVSRGRFRLSAWRLKRFRRDKHVKKPGFLNVVNMVCACTAGQQRLCGVLRLEDRRARVGHLVRSVLHRQENIFRNPGP